MRMGSRHYATGAAFYAALSAIGLLCLSACTALRTKNEQLQSCARSSEPCDDDNPCPSGQVCGPDGQCACHGALRFEIASLPQAVVGQPYRAMLVAAGGSAPYTFRLLAGDRSPMLEWLSLDPVSGRLTGTPPRAHAERYGLRVTVEDETGATIARAFELSVAQCEDGGPIVCFVEDDDRCLVGLDSCEDGVATGRCQSPRPSSDIEHCGEGCGACSDRSNRCEGGLCACGRSAACANGELCCGEGDSARCVNPSTDPEHCGSCELGCDPGDGLRRVAVCRGGVCQEPACEPSWGACDPSAPLDCTTDVTENVNDCGACGNACPIPTLADDCSASRCVCGPERRTCTGDETCCAGVGCVDFDLGLRVDGGLAHCGGCDAPLCPDPDGHGSATCRSGECGTRCEQTAAAMWVDCNVAADEQPRACTVDLFSDPQGCGGCGVVCPEPSSGAETGRAICAMGACAFECADGRILCPAGSADVPGACVDVQQDPLRCGNCDTVCSSSHVTPACEAGVCGGACEAGYGDCLRELNDGCETQLLTDDAHCGACGVSCAELRREPGCADGVCTGPCSAGYGDCDGDPDNGCETPLGATLEHCGACSQSCASLHVQTDVCQGGACIGACEPGYRSCGVDARDDSCEVHIDSDVNHCGQCGRVCSARNVAALACSGGLCTGSCSSPRYADCYNGLQADGCETDLSDADFDQRDCGACGTHCAPGLLCADIGGFTCIDPCAFGGCGCGATTTPGNGPPPPQSRTAALLPIAALVAILARERRRRPVVAAP
jgi:hypothetical protein